MTDTCVCGDVEDEHGGDPDFPGSFACRVEGCECLHFEPEDDGEDEDDIIPEDEKGLNG